MSARTRTLLLRSLEYPNVDKFSIEDFGAYKALVVWLEDMKIRFLKTDERTPLRTSGPQWTTFFSQLVEDMGCPVRYSPDTRAEVLDYLISQAVLLEYRDNAERHNKNAIAVLEAAQQEERAAGASASGGSGSAGPSRGAKAPPLPGLDDAAVREAAVKAAALLQVPCGVGTSTAELVREVAAAAQRVLSPAALSAARSGHFATTPAPSPTALLGGFTPESFPLGFSVGDPMVDAAATVLRVLYINDLRRLQTQVDHCIVEMQEYTADPKTDAKLGRVGS